jgi:RHS repeat-associated protein
LAEERSSATVGGTVIAEKSYVWGNDLSSSLQGAGGVGGLVQALDGGNSYYYHYDANGNVIQVTDGSGNEVANYSYNAFGKIRNATGTYLTGNSFTFSTKYLDEESQLSYYGFRYYSAELGRWINRDPIEETGDVNIYMYVNNNPMALIDPLGLITFGIGITADGNAGIASGGASAGIFLGWNECWGKQAEFSFDVLLTGGLGLGALLDGFAGVFVQATDADSVSVLEDFGGDIGVSVQTPGTGPGLGGNFIFGVDPNNPVGPPSYTGAEIEVGWAVGLPVGGHARVTYTDGF